MTETLPPPLSLNTKIMVLLTETAGGNYSQFIAYPDIQKPFEYWREKFKNCLSENPQLTKKASIFQPEEKPKSIILECTLKDLEEFKNRRFKFQDIINLL